MAYSIVSPIIFASVFGLVGAFMLVWGLFKPAPTTTGKVRWVAVVIMFWAFGVGQSVVAQRQGISDIAGPLLKEAAYGVRSAEALGLTAASVTLCLSIYPDLGARLLIPSITGLGIGASLVFGSLVHNVKFDMYFWFMWQLIFFLVVTLAVWLIDHADWIAGLVMRDGEPFPKWYAWPWRIVLSCLPALFVALFPFAADTTGTASFTTFFVLCGCFEAAICIAAALNYFLAKSVDLQEGYAPVDQATNARINTAIGGASKRTPASAAQNLL